MGWGWGSQGDQRFLGCFCFSSWFFSFWISGCIVKLNASYDHFLKFMALLYFLFLNIASFMFWLIWNSFVQNLWFIIKLLFCAPGSAAQHEVGGQPQRCLHCQHQGCVLCACSGVCFVCGCVRVFAGLYVFRCVCVCVCKPVQPQWCLHGWSRLVCTYIVNQHYRWV